MNSERIIGWSRSLLGKNIRILYNQYSDIGRNIECFIAHSNPKNKLDS